MAIRKLLTTAIATILLWVFSLAAACCESLPPLLSQDIAVNLVPAEHLLLGESTLSYARRVETINLNLAPAATVDRVNSGGQAVSYTFSNGNLTVTLPRAPAGPLSINISYRLIMNDPLPTATSSSEDPSYGVRGSISPLGVFLDSSALWYPRPNVAPLARTIRISAPAGMEGITSGERLSRETSAGVSCSVWQEEPPTGDPALAAGPYLIKERQLPGLLVSTYLYPENAHLADTYLEAATGYLKLFSELFGPYPFTKFAVVENFFPTGYGFPSFTLLGSTVIRLSFITTTSLPHEIAHNWWGNGVLVDSGQGNWCEGLVTYLAEHLLEERKGSSAGRDYRLRLLTDFSLLVSAQQDFPLTRFSSRVDPASRAIGYGKGAMLWHMLRRRVGDEAFFAALRDVFSVKKFQSADWSDFSRVLTKRSGQELDSFMTPWLERPGGPRLSFADVASQRQTGGWLVTGRVVQKPPVFPLLLLLRLETVSGRLDQTLPLMGGENRFHFISQSEPRQLLLDPEVDIFRLLPPSQLPANVNRLKGSKQLLAVTTSGCGTSETSLRQLLEALGQGSARIIIEEALDKAENRNHDLVFCGLPKDAAALLDLPPGLGLAQHSFVVNGKRFGDTGDLLFLVTRQRRNPEQAAALFLPLSTSAASSAVLKISHYGSYASLVFSSGVNQHKGRDPQQATADQVSFSAEE